MYADDMLIYLEDTDLSLQTALQTIDDFGKHSGLRINWSNSQILPLDLSPPTGDAASLPLHRVSSIQYLGTQITREPLEYITNNIELLFAYLKNSNQSWAQLPLGVMGRIDKSLATFLYETLFSARKLVAKYLMRNTPPPTVQAWIGEINSNLPYKKVIYRHRGCPAKYNKVWDRLLDVPDTCSE